MAVNLLPARSSSEEPLLAETGPMNLGARV